MFDPLELELELHVSISHPTWVLEWNLGPLHEQFLFSTTVPCLQSQERYLAHDIHVKVLVKITFYPLNLAAQPVYL